jgi:hypothetical protein
MGDKETIQTLRTQGHIALTNFQAALDPTAAYVLINSQHPVEAAILALQVVAEFETFATDFEKLLGTRTIMDEPDTVMRVTPKVDSNGNKAN